MIRNKSGKKEKHLEACSGFKSLEENWPLSKPDVKWVQTKACKTNERSADGSKQVDCC